MTSRRNYATQDEDDRRCRDGLPSIPKELIDHFVTGPMSAAAVRSGVEAD